MKGFPPAPSAHLVKFLHYNVTYILKPCQHVTMSATSSNWIPGWVDPFRRVLHAAEELADSRQAVEGFLAQAELTVDKVFLVTTFLKLL